MIWSRYEEKVKDCVYIIQKLNEIGINKKCVGYFYLIKILDFLMNGDCEIVSFCEDVYPVVAKFFDVNESTIERNIRNLIMIICRDCENAELVDKIKGLSCCKFIYKIKDIISLFIV